MAALIFSFVDAANTVNINYSTTMWLPNIEEVTTARIFTHNLINGKVFRSVQKTSGGTIDNPLDITLSWEVADEDFIAVARETWKYSRPVTISIWNEIGASTSRYTTRVLSNVYIYSFEFETLDFFDTNYVQRKRHSLKIKIHEVTNGSY